LSTPAHLLAVAPPFCSWSAKQQRDEAVSGCAPGQLEREGAPVIFGNFLSSMALRSGSPTFGTPEPAIADQMHGQPAPRLNVPLRCSGNYSTSKLPDAHAMTEGTMPMRAAVHRGVCQQAL
jgi:trimethylamine--corrinoid protein Co-methyltransferase